MIAVFLLAFAILSIFWFPWLFTIGALIITEAFLPGSAIAIGIFADLLERSTPLSFHALPWGTLTGLFIFVALYLLRRFFNDRLVRNGPSFESIRLS